MKKHTGVKILHHLQEENINRKENKKTRTEEDTGEDIQGLNIISGVNMAKI